MTLRFSCFLPIVMCVLGLLSSPVVQATSILTPQTALDGMIPAPMAFFEDQTGANSVAQAAAQFARQRQTGQINETSTQVLGNRAATYWLAMTVTNNSKTDRWWLDFKSATANQISPIRTFTVYDSANGSALASWPNDDNPAQGPAVPLQIKPGETVTRYVMIQTWPGIGTAVQPLLQTQSAMDQEAIDFARKMSLFWLVVGAAFGASLIQLVLTHQSVQGFLALNALLIGAGTFLLQHSDMIPGLSGYHPVVIPMTVACLYGGSASLILWATTSRYGIRSLICLMPLALNIAVYLAVLFNLDMFVTAGFNLENLPLYALSVSSLLLIIFTAILGIADINIFWLMPGWLVLAAVPWLHERYPFAISGVYLLLLSLVGVASVFWYWKKMDTETESLQLRLRQELGNSKIRHKQETDDWTKKMETQRALLNELRVREQQRSAELEVATSEAEAANKAKSDFLAIISHEIRTPMNGIMGIVQIINQTDLDDKQSEYIDVIKNSGETMLTLLNDILDYSKIEKGMIDLEVIPFSMRKLVNSVAMLMSGRAVDKGLEVIVDIAPEIGESRLGDPSRIRQILLNLVGNAIKFTEKGSVTIRIGRRTMTEHSPPLILFEVIDTGMGISAEAQARLFQAYAQADASISRRFGGTGLGLNICRMLAQAMSGSIGVSSAENQGSTFWFELPLPAAENEHAEHRPDVVHRLPSQKTLSILVIDDNAVNLKIVSGMLQMDGHRVTVIDSAEQALAIIDATSLFDLIFVDIMMPDMDGRTFLKNLQQKGDTAKAATPVYALTGLADQSSIDNIISLGMRGVVTKPIIYASLRAAVNTVISDAPQLLRIQNIMESLELMPENEKQQLRQALGVAPSSPAYSNLEDMLNMAMLADLKVSLPPETLSEIYVELIDKAKELTTAIEHANNNNDFKTLGIKAHDLRGMAGNFGMQRLMEHSAGIEQSIRDGANAKAASLAQESRLVLEQSLTALTAWLKS